MSGRSSCTRVPRGAGERRDGAGVVQECLGVPDLGLELELVGDIRLGITVVVDVDLVQDVVAELVEVGPAAGLVRQGG